MKDINELKRYGIDTEEVNRKFKENLESYLEKLKDFSDDKNYRQMLVFIQNNDYKSAYEYAKKLKRIAGALHLGRFYNNLRVITDLLRPCEPVNTTEILISLEKDYEDILKAVNLIN